MADLSWSPVADATGYDIYKSATSGVFNYPDNFVFATARTKMSVSGLTAGTAYYYRVNAVNSKGISPPAAASTP